MFIRNKKSEESKERIFVVNFETEEEEKRYIYNLYKFSKSLSNEHQRKVSHIVESMEERMTDGNAKEAVSRSTYLDQEEMTTLSEYLLRDCAAYRPYIIGQRKE